MKRPESIGEQRVELRSSCLRLIADATQMAIEKTGSTAIPESTIMIRYLTATEPGRYSGKEYQVTEPDIGSLFFAMRNSLPQHPSWKRGEAAVDDYVHARGVQPAGFMLHDTPSHSLWPLLALYWKCNGSIAFSNSQARRCVRALLRHLDAPATIVKALIALEGFAADREFSLEPGINVHLIRDDEVRQLG